MPSSIPDIDLTSLPAPVRAILADFPALYEAVVLAQSPADLRASIATLDNSTAHLRASNTALAEAAADAGDEEKAEYLQYIADNEHAIQANDYRVGVFTRLIQALEQK